MRLINTLALAFLSLSAPSLECEAIQDMDQDGFNDFEDCDDSDPFTYPGAREICDYADNSCDGRIDKGVEFGFANPLIEATLLDRLGLSAPSEFTCSNLATVIGLTIEEEVDDLSGLENLASLQSLRIYQAAPGISLSPIAPLRPIYTLYIGQSHTLAELPAVNRWRGLIEVYLPGNAFTEVDSFYTLPSLSWIQHITLEDNCFDAEDEASLEALAGDIQGHIYYDTTPGSHCF